MELKNLKIYKTQIYQQMEARIDRQTQTSIPGQRWKNRIINKLAQFEYKKTKYKKRVFSLGLFFI